MGYQKRFLLREFKEDLNMGGGISSIASSVGQGVGDVLTLGTDRIPGSPTQALGKGLGTIATGGANGGLSGLGGGGSVSPVQVGGQQTPLQMLEQSGGSSLLMDISLGANPRDSIMSYFGQQGGSADNWNKWVEGLSPSDQNAVNGLLGHLGDIQTNTDKQNQAVSQLSQDYPNIMTQKIQQYQNIADPAIQKMMGQAMQQISAQQSAGGMLSSGASAAAAAQVGAQYAGQELNYATGMANQDFNQQMSIAQGLQTFQQKMLGQGATQGFNAAQNMLNRNQQAGIANAGYQNQTNQYNTQQQNGMYGALGGLAGTVIGGAMGGPMGASIGGGLGSMAGGGGGSGFQPPSPWSFSGIGSSNGGGTPTPGYGQGPNNSQYQFSGDAKLNI